MSEQTNRYVSPFSERYASEEMQYIFSQDNKFITWHKLWIALAKGEKKLGLNITDEQIAELEAHCNEIDYETVRAREREVRHDVMAHVYAYGKACPKAAGIIHLGATSCYVGDNTDLIIMRDGAKLLLKKTAAVMRNLTAFALEYRSLPCLAYTHLQPAQLTTVGKRASLWIYDLLLDAQELKRLIATLPMRGVKGTTGTQASFMELFGGDGAKIKELDAFVRGEFGFDSCVPVSGQTYTRKLDYTMLSALSSLAQSAYKFSNDMRLLQSFEELEEPFGKQQIGSSAMPYKRNPMRSERISSLSRYVIADVLNPAMTAGTQWFERTLDDSANKRISVAEAFLAADAILNIYLDVSSGIVVYPKVIERRIMEKLPYMATENIMMRAVKNGADRQELHERLRVHSQAAASAVKLEGKKNDLIDRIVADGAFRLDAKTAYEALDPSLYIGRAPEQVEEFINDEVIPFTSSVGTDFAGSELKV